MTGLARIQSIARSIERRDSYAAQYLKPDRFGNYDPSDALLDHLDDQPAPVGTSRRTTLNSPVGYVALDTER